MSLIDIMISRQYAFRVLWHMNSQGWGFRKWLGTWNWQGRVHEEYVRVISLEGSKPLENKISWVEGSKPLENKRSWVIGVGTLAHYFSRRSGRGGCWRSIWGWHMQWENSYKVPVIQGGGFKKITGPPNSGQGPLFVLELKNTSIQGFSF